MEVNAEGTRMWQPIHEQHAIAAMAAVFYYSEQIPQKTLRKVVAAAEEPAFASGLRSRHSTNDGGYIYNSMSRAGDGQDVPDQLSEQVIVDSSQIIYKTMVYASWERTLERLKTLFVPACDTALQSVSPRFMRLEYLDTFIFDGVPEEGMAAGLLRRESVHLPSHIFDTNLEWHVYTGAFQAHRPDVVLQIKADCTDRPVDPEGKKRRFVDIMTAHERRFLSEDSSSDFSTADLLGGFDIMHADLKLVLADLILPSMSKAIHLYGDQND